MAALVALLMAGGGISLQVAQSIAQALADAWRVAGDQAASEVGSAETESAKPPPIPIYDENGDPFETDDKGRYWGPDEKGDWRWLSKAEAHEAAAALRGERSEHNRRRAQFEREAAKDRGQWWQEKEEEAQTASREKAERDARARANEAENDRQRNALTDAIFNTINEMPPSERSSALMQELAEIQQRGNLEEAQLFWDHLRGKRQSQLDQWQQDSRHDERLATVYRAGETGATLVRDAAKAQGAAVTSALVPIIGLPAAAAAGAVALGSIGAAEGGVQFDKATGKIVTDGFQAARGAMRGVKSGATAAIGGVPTGGNPLTAAGKVLASAGLDGAEAYGDAFHDTYDKTLAKTGDHNQASQSANRAGWDKGKKGAAISAASNATGEIIDARAATRQQGLDPDLLGRDQFLTEAAKSSANVMGNTASGMALKGQDLPTALGGALYGEALGRTAQGINVGLGVTKSPLSGWSGTDASNAGDGTHPVDSVLAGKNNPLSAGKNQTATLSLGEGETHAAKGPSTRSKLPGTSSPAEGETRAAKAPGSETPLEQARRKVDQSRAALNDDSLSGPKRSQLEEQLKTRELAEESRTGSKVEDGKWVTDRRPKPSGAPERSSDAGDGAHLGKSVLERKANNPPPRSEPPGTSSPAEGETHAAKGPPQETQLSERRDRYHSLRQQARDQGIQEGDPVIRDLDNRIAEIDRDLKGPTASSERPPGPEQSPGELDPMKGVSGHKSATSNESILRRRNWGDRYDIEIKPAGETDVKSQAASSVADVDVAKATGDWQLRINKEKGTYDVESPGKGSLADAIRAAEEHLGIKLEPYQSYKQKGDYGGLYPEIKDPTTTYDIDTDKDPNT